MARSVKYSWFVILMFLAMLWPLQALALFGDNPVNVSDGDSSYDGILEEDGLSTVTVDLLSQVFSGLDEAQDAIHTSGGGYTIDIYGSVYAYGGYDAIEAVGDYNIITNYSSDSIYTRAYTFSDDPDPVQIPTDAGDAIVTGNYADITNEMGALIVSDGSGIVIGSYGTVYNLGVIDTLASGIIGVDYNEIYNYGSIYADQTEHITSSATGIAVNDYNLIINEGYIESDNSNGISAGNFNVIINSETGQIWTEALADGLNGIVAGNNNTVTNDGTITTKLSGIKVGDDNYSITNTGSIYSSTEAMELVAGIQAGDGNLDISNSGYIEGLYGIFAGDDNIIINEGDGEPEPGDPIVNIGVDGFIYGSAVGVLLQVDPSDIDAENINQTILNNLLANVNPDLEGNLLINDGVIGMQVTDDIPGEIGGAGIVGVANNTIINNGLSTGFVTGIGGLEGNTIINNGIAAGSLAGVILRNNGNELINNGSVIGEETGVITGIGNSIINNTSGYIGIVDPDLIGEVLEPAAIGIVAFDDNTITNSGTIVAKYAGIMVSSEPFLEALAGDDPEIVLPDYLTGYVPVGNQIVNNGTIFTGSMGESVPFQVDAQSPFGIYIDSRGQLMGEATIQPQQIDEYPTGGYWDYVTEEQIGSVFFNQITNNGIITSFYDDSPYFGSGIYAGDFSNVVNNGTIDVTYTGIAGGFGNSIVNNGEIYSDQESFTNFTGIHVADLNYIENNGLIDSFSSSGIIAGNQNEIVNNADGVINAADETYGNGVDVQDGNTVTNHGTINALYNAAMWETGLPGHSHGIHAVGGNDIYNDGSITAGTAGIEAIGDDNDIVNADGGVIRAYQVGIAAGNPFEADYQPVGNRVTNEGLIGAAPTTEPVDDYDHPVATGITVANQATVINGCADGECTGTIHADYAGIATGGYGDVITNYGTIYVYGGGMPDVMFGELMSYGDAGISVGGGYPEMKVLNGDTTLGIGDHAALEAAIVNTVTNYGLIDAYYEGAETGAAGIRAYDHNRITNAGTIDAIYEGIVAGSYNIITNTADGSITADQTEYMKFPSCGIKADNYNLISNTAGGFIASILYEGIYVGDHNEITNSGEIEGWVAGISTGNYNLVTNAAGGTIIADNDSETAVGIRLGSALFGAAATNSYSTTRGVTDEQYVLDNIVNRVINNGYIWADDTGIAAGSNAEVTNGPLGGEQDGEIHGGHTGISGEWYNIITNNGYIHSDFLTVNATGISVGYESIVTNNGEIWSETSTGISAGFHNDITNNGLITAATAGIYGWEFNRIENSSSGEISATTGIEVDHDNDVINSGDIVASEYGVAAGNDNRITNSGGIEAGMAGIYVVGDGVHADYLADDGLWYYDEDTVNVITNAAAGNIEGGIGIDMTGAGIINTAGTVTAGTGSDGIAIQLDGTYSQLVTLQSGAVVNGHIMDGNFGDSDRLTLEGSGTFSYDSYGIENIRKVEDGIWILGPFGYVETEWIDIVDGTLQVDGNLEVNDLYVYDGATLAGNGYISTMFEETVYNGGTIAPGPANPESLQDHIGTLDISGTFANYHCPDEGSCTSGNLDIELYDGGDVVLPEPDGPEPLIFEPVAQKNDEIYVYSVTTAYFGGKGVDGGTVTAIPLNYIADGRYTFLYTDSLVVNSDPALIAPSALLNFSLGWDETAMWLDVTQNSIGDIGGNENDQTIFDVINGLADEGAPAAEDLLTEIVQSANPLDLLGMLSPEQYPNLLDVSMAGFDLYRAGVVGRMGNLHLTRGARDLMYADNSNTLVSGDPALSRLPAFQRTKGGWSGWARVLGLTGDQDGDNGKLGFEIDSFGLALGFDNQVNDNLVLGIGGGYTESDVDFDDLGQDTDMEGYHIALYGSYSTERWYLDGALLYVSNDYDTDRMTPGSEATSSTDGTEWGVYLGGGWNLVDDTNWYFIPTISAQWAQVDIDGFTEKGAGPFNLDVDDYDTDSLVTTLGFRIGANLTMGQTKVEPEFRLAWAHEFGDTDRDVRATFAMGGPSFTIEGVEPDEDSALVGAGINAHLTDTFTIFVDYDGEFRSDFDAHMLSGGLRYNF